jgi:hypothetical protein
MPTKVGIHDFSCSCQQSRGWRAFARHDVGNVPRCKSTQAGSINRVHLETVGFSLAGARAVPIFRSSLEQGLSDRCYELTMGAGSRQWRICAIWP